MENKMDMMPESKRKYKLYKDKRFYAILLVATIMGGSTVFHLRRSNRKIHSNSNYVVGYSDISFFNGITNQVEKNNFVLLDIGDHNSDGVFFQKQKLDYCVKHGIDIGLILSSNSTTMVDIYFDLEYLMGIMERYPINYPVYFNVNGILDNEKLTLQESIDLIDSFLEKAEQNNIYVGLYGKQENMLECYQDYDKIVMGHDEIRDIGIIHEETGLYYADLGLKNNIQNNLFNDSSYFKEDGYYIYQKGDSLKAIAQQYHISVNDLKRYNHLYFSTSQEGDVLRIPSVVQNLNNDLSESGQFVATGIDVSLWQGEIDWEQVEVDYAIIQIRDFINQENDSQFVSNVEGCLSNNIPMGFYVFSRATSIDEVEKEARYVVEQLTSIPVTYPVYLDLEGDFWNSLDESGCFKNGNYSKEETTLFVIQFLKTWEKEMLAAGYLPGIYCNRSLYDKLKNVTNSYIDNFSCWVAGGEFYNQEFNYEIKENFPEILLDDEAIAMKQISQKGNVHGIDGNVDINYCYVDYENSNYHWDRMNFFKYENKLKVGISMIGLGGMFLAIKRKKKKKKQRVR